MKGNCYDPMHLSNRNHVSVTLLVPTPSTVPTKTLTETN